MARTDAALHRLIRSFAVTLGFVLLARTPVYAQARFSEEVEELNEVLTLVRERFSLMPSVASFAER